MKLTQAESGALTRSVEAGESFTSAELVLVILGRSYTAAGGPAAVGAALSLTALALILFLEDFEVTPFLALTSVAAVGLAGVAVALLLPPRWLASAEAIKRAVDEKAHAAFSRHGVHRTSGRTGVLLFLSLGERQARLLYDVGVAQRVPGEVREAWRARFAALARAFDVEAAAAAVKQLGQEAGAFLPRSADDVDELANAPQVDA